MLVAALSRLAGWTGQKATDPTAREMRQSTSRSDQLRRQVSGDGRRRSISAR
jgi:hypothetical protein